MIAYRQCDRRFPFLWESSAQPEARWHRGGEGPVQYLADTPAGAWAEFLRHEEITDEDDLAGVSRALWVVDVEVDSLEPADLDPAVITGDTGSYHACQTQAERLRDTGAKGLVAPSAALIPGAAAAHRVDGGLRKGPPRDGEVVVLFGARPDALGWPVVLDGRPPADVLAHVRPLQGGSED